MDVLDGGDDLPAEPLNIFLGNRRAQVLDVGVEILNWGRGTPLAQYSIKMY